MDAVAAWAWKGAESESSSLSLASHASPSPYQVACEHGLRLSARHWRLGFLSALALESIGLLSTAEATPRRARSEKGREAL